MATYSPIDISKVKTIQDVEHMLQHLNNDLDKLNLSQFKLFNNAYYIVTKLIQAGIHDDYFSNSKFVQKFIVAFADHYFMAVNSSCTKSQDIAPAWAKLNEYAQNKHAPNFIALMLGANAHINNDLPFVLNDLMKNSHADDLLADVAKISKLLMITGREVIGTFKEDNDSLDFLKRNFQFMYYRPAMYTIMIWRLNAYRSYKKFKKDASYSQAITSKSVRIAKRWLLLSKLLTRTK